MKRCGVCGQGIQIQAASYEVILKFAPIDASTNIHESAACSICYTLLRVVFDPKVTSSNRQAALGSLEERVKRFNQ